MISNAATVENLTDTAKGNGRLPLQLPFRLRARAYVRNKLQNFTMTKTAEGKYTISQPLALCVLAALFSIGAAGWWRSSDKISEQHDEIIILRTRLEVEKEKNADQDSKIDQARATAQVAGNNVSRLEGKFDQFSQVYAISNPKKAMEKE